MDKNPYIFLTGENQHIRDINKKFDGTLNHYGPMVFAENQEKMNPKNLRPCCCNQTRRISF